MFNYKYLIFFGLLAATIHASETAQIDFVVQIKSENNKLSGAKKLAIVITSLGTGILRGAIAEKIVDSLYPGAAEPIKRLLCRTGIDIVALPVDMGVAFLLQKLTYDQAGLYYALGNNSYQMVSAGLNISNLYSEETKLSFMDRLKRSFKRDVVCEEIWSGAAASRIITILEKLYRKNS